MQRLEHEGHLDRPIVDGGHEETSVEEDLRDLKAVAPELIQTLPKLFLSAVVDSITNGMGEHDFGLVLKSLPGIGPEHRFYVFRFLESLYGERATELEQAIDSRFQSEVKRLLRQATSGAFALHVGP